MGDNITTRQPTAANHLVNQLGALLGLKLDDICQQIGHMSAEQN